MMKQRLSKSPKLYEPKRADECGHWQWETTNVYGIGIGTCTKYGCSPDGPDPCCEEHGDPFEGSLRPFHFYRESDNKLVATIEATQLPVAEIVFLASVSKGTPTVTDQSYKVGSKRHRVVYIDPSAVQGEIVVEDTGDHEAIAKRAYSYWVERGRPEGSPEQDWFRAEQDMERRFQELRQMSD